MDLLFMIILGALAGWIASMIMHSAHGVLMDVVLGIVGAVVGGLIMGLFGQSGVTGFNLYSILVAIVGAIVLIAIGRMFEGRSAI
jgi:uncharacterized membrane protein YeaQ/YmgE (transglycosylase-associated protein family)